MKSMSVSYTDNKAPITFYVRYSDNGTSDTIQKKCNTKEQANQWLGYWYGDTSGGFEYLERAKQVVNNLIN
jgi:hypothetical protein